MGDSPKLIHTYYPSDGSDGMFAVDGEVLAWVPHVVAYIRKDVSDALIKELVVALGDARNKLIYGAGYDTECNIVEAIDALMDKSRKQVYE